MQDKIERLLINGKPLNAKATARLSRIKELISYAVGSQKDTLVYGRKRRSS